MLDRDETSEPCGAVSIAIVWQAGPGRGEIELSSGKVSSIRVAQGDGKAEGETFSIGGYIFSDTTTLALQDSGF